MAWDLILFFYNLYNNFKYLLAENLDQDRVYG